MTGMGVEAGAQAARSRALAVLRIRSRALAVALLPAAAAVVLLAGGATGHFTGPGWSVTRWIVTVVAVVVLLCAAGVALVVARARPAMSPTVPIPEQCAPDLYRLVRDLADRLDVPAPSAIALTPDCDSWLEDRTHPSHGPPPTAESSAVDAEARGRASGARAGPSALRAGLSGLSQNLSGLRHSMAEIRGGLSHAGNRDQDRGWNRNRDRDRDRTGARGDAPPPPGRHGAPAAPVLVIGSPFLWWMRVGELRAVLAPVVAGTGPSAHPDIAAARRFIRGLDAAVAVTATPARNPVSRAALTGAGWVARLLLRSCREHAAEMERGVAAAASERAQTVDYGLRIVAQEQVGLAYAGWDRLLTRVALPAWRMGRWPSRLDAGVVAALTELSRRDRLAEGFASRLGERPACDLLEEPGVVDEATSLLAARLFHGGPAEPGPDWAPVGWHDYPDEVVDRKWRMDAARLHRVLDALGVRHTTDSTVPDPDGPTLARVMDHLTIQGDESEPDVGPGGEPDTGPGGERMAALAAGLSAEMAREEAAAPTAAPALPGGGEPQSPDRALWDDGTLPLFPLQPPRTGREVLTDHVTAMVCCAAMDTAGATPGLDWLDGPSLLIDGERTADLAPRVLALVEDGDPAPLRDWLRRLGIRPEKPVRLV